MKKELKNATTIPSMNEEIKDSLDIENTKLSRKSRIPDGGWGWIVLASAVFSRIIMVGIYVTFALYTKDFVHEFKISPSLMGWMISIYSCVFLLAAPLAALLAVKYGNRTVSIFGLLIAALAHSSTYLYPTLWYNFLTASFIVPFSQGIANMCGSVILTTYFDKRLPIALGIYSCSSGIASFAITPIMSLVINRFGWKLSKPLYSMMYILAAISILSFRPAVYKEESRNNAEEENRNLNTEIKEESHNNAEEEDPNAEIVKFEKNLGSKDSNICNLISTTKIVSNISLNNDLHNNHSSLRNLGLNTELIDKNDINMINVPMSALVGMSTASSLHIKTTADNKKPTSKPSGYIKLLKKPIFILFLVSNLFTNMGYDTPYIFTKSKSMELGVKETKATFLLTCIGIGNILGRLGFGYLGSIKRLNSYLLNTFCLLLAGSFIIFSRIAYQYPLMVLYTVGYGTFIGGFITLGPVLLLQLLDISNFSHGLSLLSVVQAIGLFAGAPMSGMIYDLTLSFNWSFMICGILIFLSGLLLFLRYLPDLIESLSHKIIWFKHG